MYITQPTTLHNCSYNNECALFSQRELFKTHIFVKFNRHKRIGWLLFKDGSVGEMLTCFSHKCFSYSSIREHCHGRSISCANRDCNGIKLDKPFSLRMKEHLYKSVVFSVIILEVQFMKGLSYKIFTQED